MRKLAFILVLGLAACQNQTALDRVTILEQSLTAAETGFLGYLHLPDCDTGAPQPCSDDAVVARVQPIDNAAFNAVQTYRDAVIAGQSDTILKELLTAAQNAIIALSAATAGL